MNYKSKEYWGQLFIFSALMLQHDAFILKNVSKNAFILNALHVSATLYI